MTFIEDILDPESLHCPLLGMCLCCTAFESALGGVLYQDGRTPIWVASRQGDQEIVCAILEKKPDLNVQDKVRTVRGEEVQAQRTRPAFSIHSFKPNVGRWNCLSWYEIDATHGDHVFFSGRSDSSHYRIAQWPQRCCVAAVDEECRPYIER